MSVRQTNGEPFKVSSLKAIRAAIDRYLKHSFQYLLCLKQAPINKQESIVGDYEFMKANDTLNAVCKNLMKEGKVRPVVHKTPITSEQLQKLFESSQLGNADTKDPKQLQQTAWFYTYLYFGRRGRENQRSLTPKMLILRQTPQGRRFFELRRVSRGGFVDKKPPRRLNDNTDEADGKMFVNSFPKFENEKDFEIKLSLSLTSFFLPRFASF